LPHAASANTGLAAKRSRRAAANVFYREQLEQEEQSQENLGDTASIVSHIETEKAQGTSSSPRNPTSMTIAKHSLCISKVHLI
jgi:hypothetical protein